MWDDMMQAAGTPGLNDFRSMFLLVNSKNLKLLTKRDSPLDCFISFHEQWQRSCDSTYLEPETTWIDYAKEIVHPHFLVPGTESDREDHHPMEPRTFLWRSCCLESHINHLKEQLNIAEDCKGFRSTFYQWALTKEACNMTLQANKNNALRRAGHAYAQFYSPIKEVLDTAKKKPFTNTGLEALAIDPHLTKAVARAGGSTVVNLEQLQQAYLSSRDRTMLGLEAAAGKSFGIREEHRITIDLIVPIISELNRRQAQSPLRFVPREGSILPWWTLPTRDVASFLQANLLRFALPFEYVRSQVHNKQTTWSQSKMMVMLLRGMRVGIDAALLPKETGLWKDEREDALTGDCQWGMDFEGSMQKYNYAWLGRGRIDWRRMDWRDSVANNVLFHDNALFVSYKRRWKAVKTIAEKYRTVDRIAVLLGRFRGDSGKIRTLRLCMMRECSNLFRRWVWDRLSKLLKFESPSDRENCLEGRVPLCIPEILQRAGHGGMDWKFPCPVASKAPTPVEMLNFIWGFDDGIQREWEDCLEFRQFHQHCYRALRSTHGQQEAQDWHKRFLGAFALHNNTMPRPTRHHFAPRDSKDSEKRYNWLTLVNGCGITNLDYPTSSGWKGWRFGSLEDYNERIPTPAEGPGVDPEHILSRFEAIDYVEVR